MLQAYLNGLGVAGIVYSVAVLFAVINYAVERSDKHSSDHRGDARLLLGTVFLGPVVGALWPVALVAGIGWFLWNLVKDAW